MPTLNDNKYYAEPPKRAAILVPDDLRADWLLDFAERIATQLNLNDTEKHLEFYDYEAGKNVFGTAKRTLYCIYTHPDTNANQQFRIASGIHEDIPECSPGFLQNLCRTKLQSCRTYADSPSISSSVSVRKIKLG